MFFQALEPPDEDIDLDDYDESDDEDPYDWYTFARAMDGRVDAPTEALLKTAAFALKAATDAGAGPGFAAEWGGVFGDRPRTNRLPRRASRKRAQASSTLLCSTCSCPRRSAGRPRR